MLKVARTGRRRSNSFIERNDEPSTPLPTPSSSYIPDSILENQMLQQSLCVDLQRAAVELVLSPDSVLVNSAEEENKYNKVKQMCSNFYLSMKNVSIKDSSSSSSCRNQTRKEIDFYGNGSTTIRLLLLEAASGIGFLIVLILVFLIIKRACIHYRHPATLKSYSNCASLDCEMV